MSMGPSFSRVLRASVSISETLEASPLWISIGRLSAASSDCNERRRSSRRAEAITRAPARANNLAVSRPMPLEAPIIRTVWFVRDTGISDPSKIPSGLDRDAFEDSFMTRKQFLQFTAAGAPGGTALSERPQRQ